MAFIRIQGAVRPRPPMAQISVQRMLDVTISAVGLVALAPIILCVAFAILIESGRPIFFSQVRLGAGGRHFRIHKFRKFRNVSGIGGRPVTLRNDTRMTVLGRLLYKTKLDELPQLWNILKGDMSIVGPRPESLQLSDCFVGRYLDILDHRPGIFGPNQVLFVNECCLYPEGEDPQQFYREVLFPLKASVDLAYFAHRTVLSDFRWIARGVLATLGWRSSLEAESVEAVRAHLRRDEIG
jgi:lipopolysaccharide/colanic/teichoic acid biosynthesis glycosyltransferase